MTDIPKRKPGRPPGGVGTANRDIDYTCHRCLKQFDRETLRAKKVQYLMMGRNGKVIRSRVIEWLCVPCMEKDPDYNRELWIASPGMKDIRDAQSA